MSKRLFLSLALLFHVGSAWAVAPVTMYGQAPLDPARYASVAAISTAYAEWATRTSSYTFTITGVGASGYNYKQCSKTNPAECYFGSNTPSQYKICASTGLPPVNSQLPLDQQCPAAPPPTDPPPPQNCPVPAGTETTWGEWTGWGPIGATKSDGSESKEWPDSSHECTLKDAPRIDSCHSKEVDGRQHFYCLFTGTSAGGNANPSDRTTWPPDKPPVTPDPKRSDMPPTPAPPATNKCPAGSVMAGYNSSGTPMCVGTGATPPGAPPAPPPIKTTTTTTANPDGGKTDTTTTTKTNADGSTTVTVTKVVTAVDGSKETTGSTTTGTTAGGKAGVDTPATEQPNFCKQNPNLSICRESSVSGKCAETACMGDAIQCATLRAAAMMQCKQQADEDALKTSAQTVLGSSILGGTDPLKGDIDAAIKGTEVDVSKTTLDQSGFLGGGSCLPNKTMSVMGRPVVIDFADLCGNIQPLRGVIMACAFILAYMLVSRSVLQS